MSSKTYVMYGYSLHNEDDVAYYGEQNKIVTDVDAAKRFYSKPRRGQKGFGTPQQWLELVNDDSDLSQGYKFHLVAVAV